MNDTLVLSYKYIYLSYVLGNFLFLLPPFPLCISLHIYTHTHTHTHTHIYIYIYIFIYIYIYIYKCHKICTFFKKINCDRSFHVPENSQWYLLYRTLHPKLVIYREVTVFHHEELPFQLGHI